MKKIAWVAAAIVVDEIFDFWNGYRSDKSTSTGFIRAFMGLIEWILIFAVWRWYFSDDRRTKTDPDNGSPLD